MVANVVENALKYASSRVTVTTGYFDHNRPTLQVEDDGPGIPPEDLERVFERLFQSRSPTDRQLGSGLGLAIVRELVSAMGGEVRAESPTRPDGGTRLVILLRRARLPVTTVEASAMPAVPARPAQTVEPRT